MITRYRKSHVVTQIATRYCEICGAALSWHTEHSTARYNSRRFCSQRCHGKSLISHKEIRCRYCNNIIERNHGVELADYRRRKFCGKICFRKYKVFGDKNEEIQINQGLTRRA